MVNVKSNKKVIESEQGGGIPGSEEEKDEIKSEGAKSLTKLNAGELIKDLDNDRSDQTMSV